MVLCKFILMVLNRINVLLFDKYFIMFYLTIILKHIKTGISHPTNKSYGQDFGNTSIPTIILKIVSTILQHIL